MRTIRITASLLLLAPLVFAGCSDAAVAPDTDMQPMFASGGNGVLHVAAGGGYRLFALGSKRRVFSFGAQEYDDRPSTGQFQQKIMPVGGGPPESSLHATVLCLSVPDFPSNEAWIAGVITKSSVADEVGRGAWFRVKDQGERPEHGNDQISMVEVTKTTMEAIGACEGNTIVPKFAITRGNIQVAAGG
jgi:hypothetical protein